MFILNAVEIGLYRLPSEASGKQVIIGDTRQRSEMSGIQDLIAFCVLDRLISFRTVWHRFVPCSIVRIVSYRIVLN